MNYGKIVSKFKNVMNGLADSVETAPANDIMEEAGDPEATRKVLLDAIKRKPGRPKGTTSPSANPERLQVKLPPGGLEALDKLAAEHGITRSDYVRNQLGFK